MSSPEMGVPLGELLDLVDEALRGLEIRQDILVRRLQEGRFAEVTKVLDESQRLVDDMLDDLLPPTGEEREVWARRANRLRECRGVSHVLEEAIDELGSSDLADPLRTLRADARTAARPLATRSPDR